MRVRGHSRVSCKTAIAVVVTVVVVVVVNIIGDECGRGLNVSSLNSLSPQQNLAALKRFKTLITYSFPRLTAERLFSFRFFPFFLIYSSFPRTTLKFKQSAEFERRDFLASSVKADCQKQKPRQWHPETSDEEPVTWLRTNLYA